MNFFFGDLWATVADYSGSRAVVGLNVSRREGPSGCTTDARESFY